MSALLLQESNLESRSDEENAKRCVAKRPWTDEEDKLLVKVVDKYGAKQWSVIASFFEGRMGKQCRERWVQHLQPSVVKGNWTKEEDHLIMEIVNEIGTKWNQIAKMLPGRGDNAIKNRYNSNMRKLERQKRQQEMSEQKCDFDLPPDLKRGFREVDDSSSGDQSPKKPRNLEEQNAIILELSGRIAEVKAHSHDRYRLVRSLMKCLQDEMLEHCRQCDQDPTSESESEVFGTVWAESSRCDDGSLCDREATGSVQPLTSDEIQLALRQLDDGSLFNSEALDADEVILEADGAKELTALDESWKVSDFFPMEDVGKSSTALIDT